MINNYTGYQSPMPNNRGMGLDFATGVGGQQVDPNQFGSFSDYSGYQSAQPQNGYAQMNLGGQQLGQQPGQAPGMTPWGKAQVGLQAGSALLQGILGYQQLGIAKDQLGFQKKAFQANYDAQTQSTNTQLEDRQRARVARNPGHYQAVDEYMSANRVGG